MILEFNKTFKELLTYQSIYAKHINDSPEKFNKLWNKNKNISKYIGNFELQGIILNIYLIQLGDILEIYMFDDTNEYILIFLNFFLEPNGGISIEYVWKRGATGINMSDIFSEFLLSHFKYILSDNTHTFRGLHIYQRLVNDPAIKVTVIDQLEHIEIPIMPNTSIQSYWGPEDRKFHYIFKIEKRF